mmetsp:Transcript_23945/g.59118  ORF Transcript_23945/g.59118 Transcript_23945/m.59118 type:complete len:284 (+) Transcript_23945:381-1232(+)
MILALQAEFLLTRVLEIPQPLLHQLPRPHARLLGPINTALGARCLCVHNVRARLLLHLSLDLASSADEPAVVLEEDGVCCHGVFRHDLLCHGPRLGTLTGQPLDYHHLPPACLEKDLGPALALNVLHCLASDPDQGAMELLLHIEHLLHITHVHPVHLEPALAHPVAVHLQSSRDALRVLERDDATAAWKVVPRPVDHSNALNLPAATEETLGHLFRGTPWEPAHEHTPCIVVGGLEEHRRCVACKIDEIDARGVPSVVLLEVDLAITVSIKALKDLRNASLI